MLLSEVLKDEMMKRNLSIKDIAECSGVSYSKICSFASGKVPKKNDLEMICEALGINSDDIVFDELNISVNETAQLMHKNPNFVKSMVKNGVFGYYDGSSYHIPRLKVEQYMGLRSNNDFKEFVGLLSYAIKDVIQEEIKKSNFSHKKLEQ